MTTIWPGTRSGGWCSISRRGCCPNWIRGCPVITHLYAMSGNRTRVLTDWAVNAITAPEPTALGAISAASVPLDVDNPRA
jgi:hypothetical protein